MTNRERVKAILHYESYDRMPVVAFGYWTETLEKWAAEGYISQSHSENYASDGDNGAGDRAIMAQLGFDFNWNSTLGGNFGLYPALEEKVLEVEPDGCKIISDANGHIVRVKPGIISIPSEIGTLLTGREAWEEIFLPRMQECEERINKAAVEKALAEDADRDTPLALHAGSLYGHIRDVMGIEELSFLIADDPKLHEEFVERNANLCYYVTEKLLQSSIDFDYAHFWEDICFKTGPLVSPVLFRRVVAPFYKKITSLVNAHGIDIVSLDCDGCIDKLVPIWLENGVNTMFPIEVGTWNASIAPWRAQYGRELRGVGGMDKRVFAQDKKAVEKEIERLKPLIDLGGYIPCPDHRIAPDAKYPLVAYYCELFRRTFG
ncbi:MAG: hypothetical protein ACOYI8_00805 [Christensenellales bacterium]|jgi:hypothetical protein